MRNSIIVTTSAWCSAPGVAHVRAYDSDTGNRSLIVAPLPQLRGFAGNVQIDGRALLLVPRPLD